MKVMKLLDVQESQNPIFVLLQCLLLALYLILLSVLYLIQLGRALFCFIFLPILVFLANDLLEVLYSKHLMSRNHNCSNEIALQCLRQFSFFLFQWTFDRFLLSVVATFLLRRCTVGAFEFRNL